MLLIFLESDECLLPGFNILIINKCCELFCLYDMYRILDTFLAVLISRNKQSSHDCTTSSYQNVERMFHSDCKAKSCLNGGDIVIDMYYGYGG